MKLFVFLLLLVFVNCQNYTDTCNAVDNCLTGLQISSVFIDSGRNVTYYLNNPSIFCNVTVILIGLPSCISIDRQSSSVLSISIAESTASIFSDTCSDVEAIFDCWNLEENGTCYSSYNETYITPLNIYRIELYPNTTSFSFLFNTFPDIGLRPALFTSNGTDPCMNCTIRQPISCAVPAPPGNVVPPVIYDFEQPCVASPGCIGSTRLIAYVQPDRVDYQIIQPIACNTTTMYIPIPSELVIARTICVSRYYALVLQPDFPCVQSDVLLFPGYTTYEFTISSLCTRFTIIFTTSTVDTSRIVKLSIPFGGFDSRFQATFCSTGCVVPALYSPRNFTFISECGSGSGCTANSRIIASFFTDYVQYFIDHTCRTIEDVRVEFLVPIPSENTAYRSECVLGFGQVSTSPCPSIPIVINGYRTYKVVLNGTCRTFRLYLNNYFDPTGDTYFILPLFWRIGTLPGTVCTSCIVPALTKYRQAFTTAPVTSGRVGLTTNSITSGRLTTGRISASVTTSPLTTAVDLTTSPATTGIFDSYVYNAGGCFYYGPEESCILNGSLSHAEFFANKIIYYYSHVCTYAMFFIPLPIGVGVSSTECIFAYGSAAQTFGTSCPIDGRYEGYVLWGFSTDIGCTTNFTLFLNTTINRLLVQKFNEPAIGASINDATSSLCSVCEVAVPRRESFQFTTGGLTTSPVTTSPLTTGEITTGIREFFYERSGKCTDVDSCLGGKIISAKFFPSSIEYSWEDSNCFSIKIRLPLPSNLTIASMDCAIFTSFDTIQCDSFNIIGYTVYEIEVEFSCSYFTIYFDDSNRGYDFSRIIVPETSVLISDPFVSDFCSICSIPTLNFGGISYTTGSLTSSELTTSFVTTGKRIVTTGEITSGVLFFDCNNNKIPDEWEIETHASKDINSNGIPDECEGLDEEYLITESFMVIALLIFIFTMMFICIRYTAYPILRYFIKRVDKIPIVRNRNKNDILNEDSNNKRKKKTHKKNLSDSSSDS